ncbi:hypothetical protein BGX26_005206 [Mortierella sp. AD094]|nr:hypothetical protein BGX26_005206 [Mortierella sp. AD094]
MSAHQEGTIFHTSASELPSTLAMSLENPSSASLALSLSSTRIESHHYHHHHHSNDDLELQNHHGRHSDSKAPSFVSGKLELVPEQSTIEYDLQKSETIHSIDSNNSNDKTDPGAATLEGTLLDYPEGGFGWLVVLASFIVYFWSFAPNVTFGVYQAHFLAENTFPGALATEISWVGSIGTASMYVLGPFVAPMTQLLGLRAVVAIGIVVSSLGLISASFATQLWHLYITQGLLFGCGVGLVLFSSLSVVSQYFEKRRGLANGIAVAGSGVGGLAMAPLTRLLIAKVGYRWCLRIIGMAVFTFLTAVFPFIRPRIKTVKKGPIFDFSLFKIPGFIELVLTALVITFGYMIPIFLIPTYTSQVLSEPPTTGANLLSMFSGINAAARIVSVATNLATLTGFMAVYGIFGGGFISIFPVVAAQVVGVERLSSALGVIYFGNVFDSSAFYIQGGATSFNPVTGVYTTIPQTFSIDLSVSWNTNQPAFKSFPDGPSGSLTTAAIAPDNQAWFLISKGTSRTFDIKSSAWNDTLSNNQFGPNPGQGAVTDPDGGMIYIPTITGDTTTGVTSLLAGHVTGEKIDNVNTQQFPNVVTGFNVAWSVALRSMIVFGGSPTFGFPKQNDNVYFFTPATGTWGTLNLNTSQSIPAQRTGSCFLPTNGGSKMILFGGLSNPVVLPLVAYSDLYILDTASRTWIKGASAPATEGRQGAACAVSNGQLVVWGGWDISYNPMKNTTLVYNINTNTWVSNYTAPPIPTTTPPASSATSGSSSTHSPSSTPSPNTPSNNPPNIPVIAGGSVGGLVVVVVGVLFVYRDRRKRVSTGTGFDEKQRSLPPLTANLDNTSKDSLDPKKDLSDSPYYPPPPKSKDTYWADVYDQDKARRSPAAVRSKDFYSSANYQEDSRAPDLVLQHILSSKRGNVQEGPFGSQRFSQHPHTGTEGMMESQSYHDRTRRSPQTAVEGSPEQYHENFDYRNQVQHPHVIVETVGPTTGTTTDNILDAYFIPGSPGPMPSRQR